MLNKKLSLIAILALGAAAAGTATADQRGRDARWRGGNGGWQYIAEVGTHRHDAEDYVSVDARDRLAAIQLRARGGAVAIEGVHVKFADGRSEFAPVNRRLRPGESVQVNLPRRGVRIEQLVLDYGNRGPYWRARETAHVQVMGLEADRPDYRDRSRDRVRVQPGVTGGVEWRGGFRVDIK